MWAYFLRQTKNWDLFWPFSDLCQKATIFKMSDSRCKTCFWLDTCCSVPESNKHPSMSKNTFFWHPVTFLKNSTLNTKANQCVKTGPATNTFICGRQVAHTKIACVMGKSLSNQYSDFTTRGRQRHFLLPVTVPLIGTSCDWLCAANGWSACVQKSAGKSTKVKLLIVKLWNISTISLLPTLRMFHLFIPFIKIEKSCE